jgi:HTH-type transcriptional repressor of puuD
MSDQPWDEPMLLKPETIAPFDRGAGAVTVPLVGKWNAKGNLLTSGTTELQPGKGIPLHTHNVEETVMVLFGDAVATIGDVDYELKAGDVTWTPAGVPHCFRNVGDGAMRIYWVYGGRHVTRTICATGETVEHLSAADRGVTGDAPGS